MERCEALWFSINSKYGTKWNNKQHETSLQNPSLQALDAKTELTDMALFSAILEMSEGLIDAELGGGVVKKRIGIAGRGKRGGARKLVATKKGSR